MSLNSNSSAFDASATAAKSTAPPGARWWSVDFHAHSPSSFDFGGLEGSRSEKARPSFEEWLRAYIEAGLDGVVIADHNSHTGIEKAQKALEALKAEDADLDIVIFPGVEITAHGGTHVLAVFAPDTNPETVNQLLVLSGYEGERGESNATASKTVVEIAEIIHSRGGICIPAHADKARGIFKMDSRDLNSLKESEYIRAVEIIDDENLAKAEKEGWIPVLGSDAHHLNTVGCPQDQEPKAPGTHLTYIKAELLNLEGIQLALADPKESIRRARHGDRDPNQDAAGFHIRSILVKHGQNEQLYSFNPWLNCLIGGRGVGKSTILELLRLSLGRSDELHGSVAEQVKRYSPTAGEKDRWWDDQTEILVDYVKDNRSLRILWSGSDPMVSTVEAWDGEGWTYQSGKASDRAPIRVFSQKQVFELANSPQSFLNIVDDMPQIQKEAWKAEYEALQLEFKTERSRLHQVLAEAGKVDRIRGQLDDVRGRLDRLSSLQETQQYREMTETEERLSSIRRSEIAAQAAEDELLEVVSKLQALNLENHKDSPYRERAEAFQVAVTSIKSARDSLISSRESWEKSGHVAKWEGRINCLTTWVSEQMGETQDARKEALQDRELELTLTEQLQKAEAAVDDGERIEHRINELLVDISNKREELFQNRVKFAESLRTDDAMTEVKIFRQGETANFENDLRSLFERPTNYDSVFSEEGISKNLLEKNAYSPNYNKSVEKFKEELIELVEQGEKSHLAETCKITGHFFSHLKRLNSFDVITQIMLWFPDDLLTVRYRPYPAATFEPVDRGSPGQRTAALLAVILQMGSEPLLLDQPEDDLENKLIKSLVVESLKRIKSERQVIVATHNANIVVTSGAENILVLNHGELPTSETKGTLQTESVKNDVCLILEGGEEAIRARYRRLVDASR